MLQYFAIALALVTLTALPAVAETPVGEAASAERADTHTPMAEIIRRGKMLYDFDQAAWHSTDALVEMAGDPARLPMVGRIVVPVEGGLQAIYYGQNASGRFAIFSAMWDGEKIINASYTKGDAGPPLSAEANGYADIVELLTSGKLGADGLSFCNKAQPNFVLLPGEKAGAFFLYFMTPQTEPDAYPLGGHHRFDIQDGKVTQTRAFTKSCIDYDKGSMKDSKDKQLVGFGVAHLLDPMPTEIHVFTALAAKSPLFVSTTQNSKMWLVRAKDGVPTIEAISDGKAK